MAHIRKLPEGLAIVAAASAAPPPPPQSSSAQQMPGLPALSELSPIIQQAAGNPEQATQLLMAAAQAFTHSPTAPAESKNVAASVDHFVQAPVAHVPPEGLQPGLQAHLPTGVDPAHAVGPAPFAAPAVPPANTPPAAALAAPVPDSAAPGPAPAAAPTPDFGRDAPPTQDFLYPSIGTNCVADGGNSIATALSVAGPATIPLPGPGPGQTAYVFTAVGTPGPAEVQKLPLNVTWVNLTTGKSGTVALKPRSDINPEGPTTLTAIADTGSGSVMSTIFGQVTTKEKQCQFMPTIGSTVVP
ncbi:hypothetical protein [Mycobacterium sp. Lab-001]|uniref:Rv1157c family protein n=1 Tax=Mycobacterium sp. Lab-001 TaxID=3410136 RepID=UPI003D175DBC